MILNGSSERVGFHPVPNPGIETTPFVWYDLESNVPKSEILPRSSGSISNRQMSFDGSQLVINVKLYKDEYTYRWGEENREFRWNENRVIPKKTSKNPDLVHLKYY